MGELSGSELGGEKSGALPMVDLEAPQCLVDIASEIDGSNLFNDGSGQCVLKAAGYRPESERVGREDKVGVECRARRECTRQLLVMCAANGDVSAKVLPPTVPNS
jgi:hypothetical protein